jgi:hypothetical protein
VVKKVNLKGAKRPPPQVEADGVAVAGKEQDNKA